MIRIHTVPVMGRYALVEVERALPVHMFPPLFAHREDALVFRAWLLRYRETSVLDAPLDLQLEIAAALKAFSPHDWQVGELLSPEEILEAFLLSDEAREALRKVVA